MGKKFLILSVMLGLFVGPQAARADFDDEEITDVAFDDGGFGGDGFGDSSLGDVSSGPTDGSDNGTDGEGDTSTTANNATSGTDGSVDSLAACAAAGSCTTPSIDDITRDVAGSTTMYVCQSDSGCTVSTSQGDVQLQPGGILTVPYTGEPNSLANVTGDRSSSPIIMLYPGGRGPEPGSGG